MKKQNPLVAERSLLRGSDNKKRVMVAMSGGIDSSVAAALLKRGACPELGRRVDVIGVFMKFWNPPRADKEAHYNRCCSPESEKRARVVAGILGIPFYVLNFEKEFKKRVVDYFLKEYKAGVTPNPCVVCNKEIKFGLLLEKAMALDADFIATGHYARIQNIRYKIHDTKYKLLRAKDKEKDQSYFLWQLNQKQLARILFPVGGYTKTQTRALAKKFKLPFSQVKDSQEVCFIQNTTNDFLRDYLKTKKGDIIDKKGKKLGTHQGLWFYTIGQRKGLGIAAGGPAFAKATAGKPYWVLAKDLKKNRLIVTQNEKDLYKKELMVKNVNWQAGKEPRLPEKVWVKIRYRHRLAKAILYKIRDTRYKIQFASPQCALTSGQSAVIYKKEELLGGGIIV